jgi:hypothetical protein
MDNNIKLAEETIKYLKDFIEVERAIKKVVTAQAEEELCTVSINMIEKIYENVKKIKGE